MTRSAAINNDAEEEGPLWEASGWCVRMASGDTSAEEEAAFRAWCEASDDNLRAIEAVARGWRVAGEAASSPTVLGMRRAAPNR